MSTSKAKGRTHGGKGSRRRTRTVDRTTFAENWDRTLGPSINDQIDSTIASMRKKGLTDEAIEIEVLKEYGTVITACEVRELMT